MLSTEYVVSPCLIWKFLTYSRFPLFIPCMFITAHNLYYRRLRAISCEQTPLCEFEETLGAATARGKSSPKFSLNTHRWVYSHARGSLKTQIIKKCPRFCIHFLLNYFHYLDGTPVIRTDENTEEICKLDGEIRNKTVLKAGMLSGKLTHHKGVKDITSCIERCCGHKKCHVAMMMAGKCYSVFCTDPQYCEPKPAPVETHHTNPTVAYVKRGDISFGKTCICLLFSFDLGPCEYQPSYWTSH